MSDLAKLLDVLGRDPGERLSLNGLEGGRFRSLVVDVATAVRSVPDPTKDCWYGTAAIHERVTSGRGYARDVIGVREVSADLDVKPTGLPSWEAARQVVDTLTTMLGVGPVAVVNSGHGLQPHWALERDDRTDWPDETDPRWSDATALWRRWGRLVASVAERYGGHTDSVFDLSRVLRVPGTTNTKGDPHVPVTVEWFTATPLSRDRLTETLDEYGVSELAGDRDVLGETVAPVAGWTFSTETCAYTAGMVDGWAGDRPEARHPWLMSQAVRLACARRLGCVTEADHEAAKERLTARFVHLVTHTGDCRGPQLGETTDALDWGVAKVATFTEARTRRELGDHHHSPRDDLSWVDDAFWTRRPWLGHVRQAAHARCVSAPAVLAITLARAAALVPHTLRLPAIVGGRANLALLTAVTGPPGSAKSSANAVARELLPAPTLAAADGLPVVADQLPLGSGEGLVEVLFGTVEIEDNGKKRQERRQVRHQAFAYIDEGEALVRLGQHDGATVMPTLRSIWSAQPIGNTNANRDRRRVVPGDAYTYGIVVALQPAKAGDLLGDADGGTPARVLWANAVDPTIPDESPDWPGPIDWTPPAAKVDHVITVDPTIADELRTDRRAVARGETTVDALDAHAGLMRLKVAALAAVLDGGRQNVTPDDWDLAGSIMRASDTTRAGVVATVQYHRQLDEQRSRERHARRETEADTATRRARTVDGARKIAGKVWAQPDRWTVRDLYRSSSRWVRESWDDALEHALAEGWVVEDPEPGQGADKRSLHPGENRP
jgi:hypothetical protein